MEYFGLKGEPLILAQCPVCLRTIWAHTVCRHGKVTTPPTKPPVDEDVVGGPKVNVRRRGTPPCS